jgi:hypothetical protein
MLRDHPAWTVAARHPVTQGHDHVKLMPDHALGQWVCVGRRTGRVLWEHEFERPNSVKGVAEGIVIATEERPVGLMGWSGFDCYAFELDTGNLVWTTHPSGECGKASNERYMYPHCYDHRGAAAAPTLVEDGMCFCRDGRVLDAASGKEVRRLSPKDVELRATRQPAGPATGIYFSRYSSPGRPAGVLISPGRRLSHRTRGPGLQGLAFRLSDNGGAELWSFDLEREGFTHSTGFRLSGPYVYVVAAEAFPSEPPPTPGDYPPLPRRYHLLALGLDRGTIRQDMPIGSTALATCKIEDVDERGLLLSSRVTESIHASSGNVLRYFERRVEAPR